MVQGFCGTLSLPSLSLSLNAFPTHYPTSNTILDLIMGGNASTIGADGARLPAVTRLRPLILRQLAEMRSWRIPACPARPTPYKKGLLLDDKDQSITTPSTAAVPNPYVIKVAAKLKQIRANLKNQTPKLQIDSARSKSINDRKDDDDDGDDEGRMIGAWPASPSFRVFFEDAARAGLVDQNGENEGVKERDSPPTTSGVEEEGEEKKKKVRIEGKRKRNMKSAMTEKRREAGNAVKNLLSVKGCYHPPTSLNTKL